MCRRLPKKSLRSLRKKKHWQVVWFRDLPPGVRDTMSMILCFFPHPSASCQRVCKSQGFCSILQDFVKLLHAPVKNLSQRGPKQEWLQPRLKLKRLEPILACTSSHPCVQSALLLSFCCHPCDFRCPKVPSHISLCSCSANTLAPQWTFVSRFSSRICNF